MTTPSPIVVAGIDVGKVAVLPARARCDRGRAGSDCGDPPPHRLGSEFRAVARPEVSRNPAWQEQIRQNLDRIGRGKPPLHSDRQAPAAELVQHIKRPKGSAIVGT